MEPPQQTFLPLNLIDNNTVKNKLSIAKLKWWHAPPTRSPQNWISLNKEKYSQNSSVDTQTTLAQINKCQPADENQGNDSKGQNNQHKPNQTEADTNSDSNKPQPDLQRQKGKLQSQVSNATTDSYQCQTKNVTKISATCEKDHNQHHPFYPVCDDNPDEDITQDSQLLEKVKKECVDLLNSGEEDAMKVTGYRRSMSRMCLCWICICLTGGLLRLVMHWWSHWYLLATHVPCPLDEAEKVLVEENYQGKHKIFYVECVQLLTGYNLREVMQGLETRLNDEIITNTKDDAVSAADYSDWNENKMHLSVHFSSAHFKCVKSLRVFNCKQLRYAWDQERQAFFKINGLDASVPVTYFHHQRGLSEQEQMARRLVYGINEIVVPYKNIKMLLFLEVLNPFYVFQIFSVILWFAYDYYYYACVIMLMSIFGISMSIIQTKKNQDVLRETVKSADYAFVMSDKGDVIKKRTQFLVPGDIIQIPTDGCTMQCDAVLLSGNCILDESVLTGESVPVTKTPLPIKRDMIFDKKEHARHTLFCGTKVIQTRYIGSEKVLAIVINTGNITAKGGLIRSIIYPPPVDYKFERDSYKFVEFLGLIAMIGFSYTLFSKIMKHIDPVKIAVESLDLITIVVPPALPAAMTVGRFYAQRRLEKNNIYCISPRSINVAGSIDCCCFDKTGTLTEDGLDMWGVVPKSATNEFQIPIKDIGRLNCDHFLFGMATCHSITILGGKMMGDPLDLKMFESTGWILEDPQDIPDSQKYGLIHPTIVRQPKNVVKNTSSGVDYFKEKEREEDQEKFGVQRHTSVNDLLADVGLLNGETNNDHGIIREFPFTSTLQRMSVITRRLSDNHFTVYCKGSPEMLKQLCHPNSIPSSYSHQLARFAKQGYRVISMAYKALTEKMSYTKAQRLTRESVECDLEFLGFIVLENRLKPDSTEVIRSLTAANIRTIMVTGDNILTALSVARDCGIVEKMQAVVTVNVRHAPDNESGHELYYTLEMSNQDKMDVENGNNTLSKEESGSVTRGYNGLNGDIASLDSTSDLRNSSSLTSVETCETWTSTDPEVGPMAVDASMLANLEIKKSTDWKVNYRFAMLGETWQIVREHFPNELRNFVTRGAIFARMSPEQKQALIMELQGIDYCVAMCGDGANDCGALKVAHTGISLSETESSIASPFTSRSPTIACVPKVIKEGRAALVTSFGIFKYMAAYSMVQFISVMILYSIDSNLTDIQYLYIDLGLISVFAFFFGKTEAYAGLLAKQVPSSSLISLTPLVSIILHLLAVVGFQVSGWFHLRQQSWFEPFQYVSEAHLSSYENYAIFVISSFQYIILAFVFSKGAPYRKPIYSNIPFCMSLLVNVIIIIYLTIDPFQMLVGFFDLKLPPDMTFRLLMLSYGAGIFLIHAFIEDFIVEYLLFKKLQITEKIGNKRQYMQLEWDLKTCHNWPPIMHTLPYDSSGDNKLEAAPIHVEMRGSQKVNMPIPQNTSLYGFFDVDTQDTPTIPHLEPLYELSNIDECESKLSCTNNKRELS